METVKDAVGEILNQTSKLQYMSNGRLKVPIVLRGAGDLMRPHAKVIHPGVVDAKVLDPIPTDDWKAEDLDRITQDVRQLFVDTLEKWPE